MVLPGFIDSHIHPILGAAQSLNCDLQGENLAVDDLVTAGRRCTRSDTGKDTGGWLQIQGVSAIGVKVDRHVVDRISRDRPILLWGGDGHTAFVNTRALAPARRILSDMTANGITSFQDADAWSWDIAADPLIRADAAPPVRP